MTRITNHAGRHNFLATWALRRLSRDDPREALIALFRSEEPLERETRLALLEALEADIRDDRSAVRLRVVKPAHRPRSLVTELELLERQQRIGMETHAALQITGAVEKNVIADAADRHGITPTEVRASLKAWQNRSFKVTRAAREVKP
jgi:hypothetical protein